MVFWVPYSKANADPVLRRENSQNFSWRFVSGVFNKCQRCGHHNKETRTLRIFSYVAWGSNSDLLKKVIDWYGRISWYEKNNYSNKSIRRSDSLFLEGVVGAAVVQVVTQTPDKHGQALHVLKAGHHIAILERKRRKVRRCTSRSHHHLKFLTNGPVMKTPIYNTLLKCTLSFLYCISQAPSSPSPLQPRHPPSVEQTYCGQRWRHGASCGRWHYGSSSSLWWATSTGSKEEDKEWTVNQS